MTAAPSFAWRTLGLVALGGAAGAGLRAALLWPGVLDDGLAIPATVAVNVVGAALLGVLVGVLGARHPALRSLLGTGVLGGFTTFSSVAVETALLAQRRRRDWAWINLVGTFVVCLAAAALGLTIGGLFPR